MHHQVLSNQSAPFAVPLFSWSCELLFSQVLPFERDLRCYECGHRYPLCPELSAVRVALFPRSACPLFSITCSLFFLSLPSFYTPIPLFSVACSLFCKNQGGW